MHIFELIFGIAFFSFVIVSLVTLIKVTKEDDKKTIKIEEKHKEKNDE